MDIRSVANVYIKCLPVTEQQSGYGYNQNQGYAMSVQPPPPGTPMAVQQPAAAPTQIIVNTSELACSIF